MVRPLRTRGGWRVDSLLVDEGARIASLDGERLRLTRAEFELLLALVTQAGSAVSSRDLLWTMWGEEWPSGTGALQAHVSRLRAKLGESGSHPRLIVTVHGFGYRFEPTANPHPYGAALSATADESTISALVSIDRVILWVSTNVERVLGVRPRELEGRSVYSLVHPDDLWVVENLAGDLDAGVPVGFMVRGKDSDGKDIPMKTLVRPTVNSDGVVTSFLAEWHPRAEVGGAVIAPDAPVILNGDPANSSPFQ